MLACCEGDENETISNATNCSAHPKCSGLHGQCCPTSQGLMLECCEAECTLHSLCAKAGLEGTCCPTLHGVMLGCCNATENRSRGPRE